MSQATQLFYLVLSAAAGAVVPYQAAANGQLGRVLGHPLWATLVSLMVGVLALLPLLAMAGVPAPQWSKAMAAPTWVWFGGLAGLLYVSTALVMAPRLGVTTFILAVVLGQVLGSMVMDHFGLAGLKAQPVEARKLIGAACVVVGFIVYSKH
jgi:bacterial/archaeal transporter family-2 protein